MAEKPEPKSLRWEEIFYRHLAPDSGAQVFFLIGHGYPLRPSTTKKSWLPPIVALKVENAYNLYGEMGADFS